MEKIVFAYASSVVDTQTLILAESIRAFAGSLSDAPIWLFTLKDLAKIPEERKRELDKLNVKIIKLELDKKLAEFPFIGHVFAAAEAERLAKEKSKFLVFLGTNSIIFKEPKGFILDENINLGYRPVHHTLIGSIFDEPIDYFWNLIYQKCSVTEENVFPMQTHVDGKILRPYFNSGFLIVKPKRELFGKWWENYQKLHNDPDFKEFYEKSDLYLTFIHQAVLSGTILSYLDKEEIEELPFEYNYPINLYHESLEEFKPKDFTNLVTVRYYLNKLIMSDDFEKIPFHEPLKSWLKERLIYE